MVVLSSHIAKEMTLSWGPHVAHVGSLLLSNSEGVQLALNLLRVAWNQRPVTSASAQSLKTRMHMHTHVPACVLPCVGKGSIKSRHLLHSRW